MSKGLYQYFKLRLNMSACSFVTLICFICIYEADYVSPILLGLLLTYSMGIQYNLTVLINIHAGIEKLMVNAERCMIMTKVPQELESEEMLSLRPEWPEKGEIEFREVNLKYRPTTEMVLNNLSFIVKPNEKIGIVGRTGSGKSTICISISRIVELFSGKIFIDGVDISTLNLNYLRSKITVIPQDPILFKGTLRYNLDPGN
jgi:ATP-binding cassette subfamily C (CFTR/MRP) protein 1